MKPTTITFTACLGLSSLGRALSDLPTKRGLAHISDGKKGDDGLLLSENSTISWYYTWSLWQAQDIQSSIPFVPLVHGIKEAKDSSFLDQLGRLPESSTHLLTFNEPDGEKDTGGSSVSPKDAAESYMSHIAPLRDSKDRKWNISHPVVTGSPQGLEWLKKFNESCYDIDDAGCPTDFVAVHWYGDAVGLKAWLQTLSEFYESVSPDLKYWVTELALPKADEETTLAMMTESLEFLDDDDSVECYAWFGAFRKNKANEWTGNGVSLLDSGGKLTDLGAYYLGGQDRGFKKGEGSSSTGSHSTGSHSTPSFICAAGISFVSIGLVLLA